MKKEQILYYSIFIFLFFCVNAYAEKQEKPKQPKLILSKSSASEIALEISSDELLKKSFLNIERKANQAIKNGIELPIPKDSGGGYSHEKHKKNYTDMYNAGLCYSITKDSKYALFVKEMLLAYADLYPSLPLHPQRKENHPAGKLFWQGLNEAVWLFYSIQAYDLVKQDISKKDKKNIEKNLFQEIAHFISIDSYETFNKIHNHGTWAVASVGMTGYVLEDKDMVERAILGSEKNKQSGFLKQLDMLFSPDGYYSEGPYYQRYAMLPFIVFAEAIQENEPERKIFEYKNKVLHKAVNTLLQLTNNDGNFYPFNDAIKEKSFLSDELVFATNIAYERYQDKNLLSVIQQQGKISITNAGLSVAKALKNTEISPYQRKALLIKDGNQGKQGGVALLRMPSNTEDQLSIVFKFASQGMGHGHFDRLSIMMYDGGREVLQDYGAARFLNVEAKEGGRYLPENKSFAKQTIAHNTVTIDGISQFNANVKKASTNSPQLIYAQLAHDSIQVVSAQENNAYKNIDQQRTIAVIRLQESSQAFILDVFQLEAEQPHQYDLNFNFMGHLMNTDFNYEAQQSLSPLGVKNGYQHLYNLAEAKANKKVSKLTFLQENKFYTISTLTPDNEQIYLTEMGANDPNFNLRHDKGFVIRKHDKSKATFVSLIEPHGDFNPQLETVQNPNSSLEKLELCYEDKQFTAVKFKFKNQTEHLFVFSRNDYSDQENQLTINHKNYSWKGNYHLFKL